MSVYLVRRIVATIPIALVTSVFVFAVMRILPGDPVLLIAGEAQSDISPAVLDRIRHEHGLGRPVYVQYVTWVRKIGTGDLGRSVRNGQPVADILLPRLLPTAQIGVRRQACAPLCAHGSQGAVGAHEPAPGRLSSPQKRPAWLRAGLPSSLAPRQIGIDPVVSQDERPGWDAR